VISSGTVIEPTVHSKKVEEIIKDLEKQRESHRYKSDNLSIVQNINEYIFGINPLKFINDPSKTREVYDEYVQCKLDEENANDSEEDNEVPNLKQEKGGHRKSIITMKSKNVFSLSQKKTTDDDKSKTEENLTNINSNFGGANNKNEKSNKITFNDDLKKQILQSHELNEFLTRNSKFIERVYFIKFIYYLLYINHLFILK